MRGFQRAHEMSPFFSRRDDEFFFFFGNQLQMSSEPKGTWDLGSFLEGGLIAKRFSFSVESTPPSKVGQSRMVEEILSLTPSLKSFSSVSS
jgi:hypothetical protein